MAVSVDAIVNAVKEYRGNVTKAAESLGLTDAAIYHRAKKSKAIKEAIDQSRNKRNSDIEDAIYKNAMAGNTALLIFIAKTQMGWREVEHIESKNKTEIIIKYADD